MNQAHRHYLAGPDWAARLEADLVPWIRRNGNLGDDVLEIGPGPGLTTDILRRSSARITALEIDPKLAGDLAKRLGSTNVEVLRGDASSMDFASNSFSAVTAFSVLHHVPSAARQDRILREAYRVLAPGGGFFATDARDLELLRQFHAEDTFVPLPLDTIVSRLENVGFQDVDLEIADYEIRFSAFKR